MNKLLPKNEHSSIYVVFWNDGDVSIEDSATSSMVILTSEEQKALYEHLKEKFESKRNSSNE